MIKVLTILFEFLKSLMPVVGKRQDYKAAVLPAKMPLIEAEILVQVEKAAADLARAENRTKVIQAKSDKRTEKKINKINKPKRREKKNKDDDTPD
jgi:hypothetical protein